MKKFLGVIILLVASLFATCKAQAQPLTLDEVFNATCRVNVNSGFESGRGTGTVVGETQDGYYILTNGHVVGLAQNPTVTVEFFKEGYKSKPIRAQIAFRYYLRGTSVDSALLAVQKSAFGNFPPTVIPLAPKGFVIDEKTPIYGAGFPAGRWLQGWKARVLTVNQNTFTFNMPPEGGQSGTSVLVNIKDTKGVEHTRVGGLLSWRFSPDKSAEYGGGLTLSRIQEVLSGQAKRDTLNETYYLIPPYGPNERHGMIEVTEVVDKNGKGEPELTDTHTPCNHTRAEHYYLVNEANGMPAKSRDGVTPAIYCPGDKPGTINHEHQKFVGHGWFLVQYNQCPGGRCWPWQQPRPQYPQQPPQQEGPQTPPPGGGGNFDGLFPDLEQPQPQEPPVDQGPNPIQLENEALKAKMAELDAKIAALKTTENTHKGEIDKLAKEKADIEGKLKASNDAAAKLAEEKAKVEAERKKVGDANVELNKLNGTLGEKTKELEGKVEHEKSINVALTEEKKNALAKAAELAEKYKDKLDSFNVPVITDKFGGIGTLLAVLLGALASGTLTTTVWHQWLYPWLVKKYGFFPAKIIGFVGKRRLSKYVEKKNSKIVEKADENAYDNNGGSLYPELEQEAGSKPVVPTPAPAEPVIHQIVSSEAKVDHVVSGEVTHKVTFDKEDMTRIKEFFNQRERDGEKNSRQTWALKADLYRQAVDQLRAGNLYYNDSESKLLSHDKTADQIDDWVTDQFYRRVENNEAAVDIFVASDVEKQAYMGWLYREAVEILRKGGFPVINYKEAARAIDGWVKKEFLVKVMGQTR